MHEGGELDPLIPSHYKLYIHLAEDDLLSGYPESRSFLFYRQAQIGGDNLDETFMENGVLLLHAGVSPVGKLGMRNGGAAHHKMEAPRE